MLFILIKIYLQSSKFYLNLIINYRFEWKVTMDIQDDIYVPACVITTKC